MSSIPTQVLRGMVYAVLLLGPAFPVQAGVFPFSVQQTRLENGLQVLFVPFDSPGLVTYLTVVRAGSRNEVEPGHTGFAHFFEHMMFRGTDRFPGSARDILITSLGADENAYTTFDATVYFVTVGTEHLPAIIDLEADRFQNLKYGVEAFQTEARAVLGEYNKNHSDPSEQMEENLWKSAYTRHTYRHTPIGFLEDIEVMPDRFDYSLAFFKRYYTPDNCTVVVVGDFDRAKVEAAIRQHYSSWSLRAEGPPIQPEPPQKEERRMASVWPTNTVSRLMIGYKAPGMAQDLRAAATLAVARDYAFGHTSPLAKKLLLEDQTALRFQAYGPWTRDPGLTILVAETLDPAHLKTLEQSVEDTLSRVLEGEIEAGRLEAIKSNIRYGTLMGMDTGLAVAQSLAYFIGAASGPEAFEAYFEAVNAVTAQDVKRIVREVYAPARRSVITMTATPTTEGGAP